MHSEPEIRQAAARAGCKVLELRRVETEYGPVWYGKHSCPNNEATFRFLLEVGQLDLADPIARSIALGFVKRFPKDEESRARAIHKWVKAHVWYIREPKETFQSPAYTVRSGAGDCDDHAILVNSLARNAGLQSKIVGLRKNGDVRHAVARVVVNGKAEWCETTVDAEFGEEPRHAVRRLKVGRSDIHGLGDDIDGTFEVKGQRILFHKGTIYRARVRVDAPKVLATKNAIASKFEDEGFSDVVVWKDPEELPADWPDDERQTVGGFGQFTAFLQGAWMRDDETKVRPEPLIALWIHKSPPGERPPTKAAEGSHAWAREMVRAAWRAHFGGDPDDATAQAVQAIASHETGASYGRKATSDGSISNNWGSIHCANAGANVDCLSGKSCPSGCFAAKDTDANGKCYITCFRQYPEPFLGAKDFVRELVVRRPGVLRAIGGGNATVIAREMRKSGYFEATVASYAAGIGRRAREIASALKEPVYVEPSNVLAGLASLGLVAGGGFFWYRYTHVQ